MPYKCRLKKAAANLRWYYAHRVQAAEISRKRRSEYKKLLAPYLRQPCADCEINYPGCMEWDHARGVKLFNIGKGWLYTRAKQQAEIDKCDVVCSRCHTARTWRRNQFSGYASPPPAQSAPPQMSLL